MKHSSTAKACAVIAATVALPARAAQLKDYGPWTELKTEPTFHVAQVNVEDFAGAANVSDDNIIFSLRANDLGVIWGPQIFDMSGQLILYSNPATLGLGWQDAHPCLFGTDTDTPRHLCTSYETFSFRSHRETVPKIYDETYRQVDPGYSHVGKMGPLDGHEFRLLEGEESFVATTYQRRHLTELPLPGARIRGYSDVWAFDGCFQEVTLLRREVLFTWCALDHTWMNESTVHLAVPAFNDRTLDFDDPLDLVHINAVDKFPNGDYLVSLKLYHALLRIAGKDSVDPPPGTVIWRLGGSRSDFKFASPEAIFKFQHHARVRENLTLSDADSPSSNDTIFISLFDNECAPRYGCSNPSSAMILALDTKKKTAAIHKQFLHPHGVSAGPGGNFDILPNGNYFVNWGVPPSATEFNPQTQEPIRHINLGASDLPFAYRSHRLKWTGRPAWKPKAVAYLPSCAAPTLRVSMSWNGATGVRQWRVLFSRSGREVDMQSVGTFDKTAFETEVAISCSDGEAFDGGRCAPGYISAMALDENGEIMRNGETDIIRVWIPDARKVPAGTCGPTGCKAGWEYREDDALYLCGVIGGDGGSSSVVGEGEGEDGASSMSLSSSSGANADGGADQALGNDNSNGNDDDNDLAQAQPQQGAASYGSSSGNVYADWAAADDSSSSSDAVTPHASDAEEEVPLAFGLSWKRLAATGVVGIAGICVVAAFVVLIVSLFRDRGRGKRSVAGEKDVGGWAAIPLEDTDAEGLLSDEEDEVGRMERVESRTGVVMKRYKDEEESA